MFIIYRNSISIKCFYYSTRSVSIYFNHLDIIAFIKNKIKSTQPSWTSQLICLLKIRNHTLRNIHIIKELISAALKYSRQRESIKEFLMTRTDHPTADTVYHQLRKIYPNISLGTVYRNLALLADIGEIQKICTGDGADRFDGQVRPHYHVICTRCHQVMDLDLDLDYMKEPEALAAEHFEGKILGHVTNFYGICPDCLKKDTM